MQSKRCRSFTPSKEIRRLLSRKTTQEKIKKANEKKELTTKDLTQWLSKLPGFVGVFPCDKIPVLNFKYPKFMIINIDTSYEPGLHWLAIRIDKNSI